MAPTPREELARAIQRWEGTWQAQPQDAGNYVTMPDGSRRLIGTMRGVTPGALAAHKGVPPHTITEADMRAITADVAAEIGETKYYRGTGLDMLAWGPATAALTDFGWGSGPGQAVKSMQRLCGAVVDGVVGPRTVEAYAKWVNGLGWERATYAVRDMRIAFYNAIIARNPVWEMYRKGWHNRANWMTPESREWWQHWSADMPALPSVVTDPAPLPKPTEPPPVVPPRTESNTDATIGKITTAATTAGAVGTAVKSFIDGVDWKVVAILAGTGLLASGGYIVFQRMQNKHKAETKAGM